MKVVGIVRVSQVKGREGESFVSPGDQRRLMAQACERDGDELVGVHEELDVSGGAKLSARKGLTASVDAIESGEADVVMVAYFDRLFRELRIQHEVVDRIEAAGGRVRTLDFGDISGKTAAQWLSGTLVGAFNEFQRRQTREKAGRAQADAIARGVPTWDQITPGYIKGPDKRLVVDPDAARAVREAYLMKVDGETIEAIRSHLLANGIRRSYHGVQALLGSRIVLGELHFGKLSNLSAHEPIVERDLWEAVQATRTKRGRAPTSKRLLARLGVLRCGSCRSPMVVGLQTQNGRSYPFYRCSSVNDCPRHLTISAVMAEEWTVERVHEAAEELRGRASADTRAREAEVAAERAQAALDGAIRMLREMEDEPTAIDELRKLRAARDRAVEEAEHLGRLSATQTIDTRTDWHRLTLAARRGLVVALIDEVIVAPGRGEGRLSCKLLVE